VSLSPTVILGMDLQTHLGLSAAWRQFFLNRASFTRVNSTDTCSVFVNGRPRPVIMEDMRSRIDRGDIKAERQVAIQAMCDIALDRASKLQA
jgi:propanediol utilization protein